MNAVDEFLADAKGAPATGGGSSVDDFLAETATPAGPSFLSRLGEAAKGAAGKVAEVATAPETLETVKNIGRTYGKTLKDVTLAPLAPLKFAGVHPDVALEVAPGAALGGLLGAAVNVAIPPVAGAVKGALWGPGEPSLKNVRQGMLDTSATARLVDELTGGAKELPPDVPRETSEVAQRYNLRALEGGYLPAPELSDEEKKALLNTKTYQEDQLRHGTHPMTPAEVEERKATIYQEPLTDIVTMGAVGGGLEAGARGLSKLTGPLEVPGKIRVPVQGEFKMGGDVTGRPGTLPPMEPVAPFAGRPTIETEWLKPAPEAPPVPVARPLTDTQTLQALEVQQRLHGAGPEGPRFTRPTMPAATVDEAAAAAGEARALEGLEAEARVTAEGGPRFTRPMRAAEAPDAMAATREEEALAILEATAPERKYEVLDAAALPENRPVAPKVTQEEALARAEKVVPGRPPSRTWGGAQVAEGGEGRPTIATEAAPAVEPPAAPAAKQPWEMTREEFSTPPKLPIPADGNVIVYHAISDEGALDSILNDGLRASRKQRGAEGPAGTLWGVDTPEGYGNQRTVIGMEVPANRVQKVAGNEYMISGDVPANSIRYVDRKASSPASTLGRVSEERTSGYGAEYHRAYVEKALSEGKPVPPEVLADYPDLAAKAAPAAVVPRTPTWVGEDIPPTAEAPAVKGPKPIPTYVEDPKFRYVIDHGGIKPYRKGYEAEENARILPLLRKNGLALDEMAESMNNDLGTHWASGDELRQYFEGGQLTPRASIEYLAKKYEAKKYGGAEIENSKTINVDELQDGQTIYQDGVPVVVSVGDQNVTLRSPEKRGWTAIIQHDAPPSRKMIDVDIEPPPAVKAQQAHVAATDATLDTIERELTEHEKRLTLANINRIAPEGIKTGLTPEQVETANHFLQDPTVSEFKIANNLRQAFHPEWRGQGGGEIPGLREYLQTVPPQYRDVRGVLFPDAINDAATNGLISRPDLREMRMMMKGGSKTLRSNKGREAAEAMLARLAESESGAMDPAAIAKAAGKVWTGDLTQAKAGEGFGIRGPAGKAINAITSRWPTLGRVFNADPAFYVRFEGKQIGPEIVGAIERGKMRAKVIEQYVAEHAQVMDGKIKELKLGEPEKARIQGLLEANPETWGAEDKALLQKIGAAKFNEAGNRTWSLRDDFDEYGDLISRHQIKERVPLNRAEMETFKAMLDKEPTAYTHEDVQFLVQKLDIPEKSARSPGFDLRNSYGLQQGIDPRFGETEFAYHVKPTLRPVHQEYDPATGVWKEVRYLTRSYLENLTKDHIENIVKVGGKSYRIVTEGGVEYDALFHRNPELADKMQRIVEPAYAAMQTAKNQGRILANAEMTHELAVTKGFSFATKEEALAAGVRQPKWIPLAEAGDPHSRLWGELAGRWVDPRVGYQLLRGWGLVDEASQLSRVGGSALDIGEAVMSAWKKNVVAKVPMSAMRDSITNAVYYFQYYGGSPTHPFSAFKKMARGAQEGELKSFIHEGGAVGSGINSHEFRSALLDGIDEASPFKSTSVHDKVLDVMYAIGEHTWGGRSLAEGVGRIAGASEGTLKTLAKVGIDPNILRFREASDTYWKFAVYLSEREKGATVRQAVQAANYHIYGMQNFPLYVRAMRATGWPFFGFTYFALTRTPEALIRHPAAFLITAGMMGTSIPVLSNLIENTETYGDIYQRVMGTTPQEGKRRKEFLPGFVSEATTLNMPFATGGGNSLILDFGPNTPLGDISTLFNMERGLYDRSETIGRLRPLSPSSPAIGTYDIMRGINPVNQQRLLPDLYTESGPMFKKQLAAIYKMLGPDPWVMNTIGKTLTALREEEDQRGMKWGVPLTAYNALSPLKTYPVNPDVQMRAATGKEHRFEGEFKQLRRQVLRNQKLTDDEKQKKIDELRRQLEERRKQAERLR